HRSWIAVVGRHCRDLNRHEFVVGRPQHVGTRGYGRDVWRYGVMHLDRLALRTAVGYSVRECPHNRKVALSERTRGAWRDSNRSGAVIRRRRRCRQHCGTLRGYIRQTGQGGGWRNGVMHVDCLVANLADFRGGVSEGPWNHPVALAE